MSPHKPKPVNAASKQQYTVADREVQVPWDGIHDISDGRQNMEIDAQFVKANTILHELHRYVVTQWELLNIAKIFAILASDKSDLSVQETYQEVLNKKIKDFVNIFVKVLQLITELMCGLELISFNLTIDVSYMDMSSTKTNPATPTASTPPNTLGKSNSGDIGSSVYVDPTSIARAAVASSQKVAKSLKTIFGSTTTFLSASTQSRSQHDVGLTSHNLIFMPQAAVDRNTEMLNHHSVSPEPVPLPARGEFGAHGDRVFEPPLPRRNPFDDVSCFPESAVASQHCSSRVQHHDLETPIVDSPIHVQHHSSRKNSKWKKKSKKRLCSVQSKSTQVDEIKLNRRFYSETDSGLMSDCEDDGISVVSCTPPYVGGCVFHKPVVADLKLQTVEGCLGDRKFEDEKVNGELSFALQTMVFGPSRESNSSAVEKHGDCVSLNGNVVATASAQCIDGIGAVSAAKSPDENDDPAGETKLSKSLGIDVTAQSDDWGTSFSLLPSSSTNAVSVRTSSRSREEEVPQFNSSGNEKADTFKVNTNVCDENSADGATGGACHEVRAALKVGAADFRTTSVGSVHKEKNTLLSADEGFGNSVPLRSVAQEEVGEPHAPHTFSYHGHLDTGAGKATPAEVSLLKTESFFDIYSSSNCHSVSNAEGFGSSGEDEDPATPYCSISTSNSKCDCHYANSPLATHAEACALQAAVESENATSCESTCCATSTGIEPLDAATVEPVSCSTVCDANASSGNGRLSEEIAGTVVDVLNLESSRCIVAIDNSLHLQLMLNILKEEETVIKLIDVCGGRCLWKEHSSMVLFSESYIYSLSRQRDNFKCKLSFSYPEVNLQYLYRKQGVCFSSKKSKSLFRCVTSDQSISEVIAAAFYEGYRFYCEKHMQEIPSELYEESEKHCKALQLCAGSELGSNNQKEISFYLPNVQLSHQNDAESVVEKRGFLLYNARKSFLSRNRWINAYFVVEGDTLYRYKNNTDDKADACWFLQNFSCNELVGSSSFELILSQGRVMLKAANPREANEWIAAFRLTMNPAVQSRSERPCSLLISQHHLMMVEEEDADSLFCRVIESLPMNRLKSVQTNASLSMCSLQSKCADCEFAASLPQCSCGSWVLHFHKVAQCEKFMAYIEEQCEVNVTVNEILSSI